MPVDAACYTDTGDAVLGEAVRHARTPKVRRWLELLAADVAESDGAEHAPIAEREVVEAK